MGVMGGSWHLVGWVFVLYQQTGPGSKITHSYVNCMLPDKRECEEFDVVLPRTPIVSL